MRQEILNCSQPEIWLISNPNFIGLRDLRYLKSSAKGKSHIVLTKETFDKLMMVFGGNDPRGYDAGYAAGYEDGVEDRDG